MKSLIPIISYEGHEITAILVDANDAIKKFDCESRINVAKTSVFVYPKDTWNFMLVEANQQIPLLSSYEVNINQPTKIDLIDILGHELCLTPGQELCFDSTVDRGLYVSYIAEK